MTDPVIVTITHRLGKAEAIRRLQEGFAGSKGHLGPLLAIDQQSWEGDTLRFRLGAFGQSANGRIDVAEDALRIELTLPWLLAKAANRLLPMLRKEATLLLEKK